MKVLLDVHVSSRIATALRQQGHDVSRVADMDRQLPDDRILSHAIAEDRVLITEDSDFSDLIFVRGKAPPPGLVYIRCRPFDQVAAVPGVTMALADSRLAGHIAVVTAENIRFRPFPKVHTQ